MKIETNKMIRSGGNLPPRNRQWLYRKRPESAVSVEHYELIEVPFDPTPASQELIVSARFISVDPYMRIQQAARHTWEEPHPLGIVQRAGVVAEVLAVGPAVIGFAPGDFVLTYTGWQEFAHCHSLEVTKLDPNLAPVSTALGVLGMPGRTAWFGLMESGRPKPGETVVVSGAAGAVGSLVVQFAKRAGCRVIGIAGGDEKCRFVCQRLGADAALDYRCFGPDDWRQFSVELARVCGGESGVDVYFDNVGGLTTDAVLPQLALRARVIICGQISQYGGGLDEPAPGPRFLQHLLFQRATIQGVLARDFAARMSEYVRLAAPWVRSGEVVVEETIIDGFEELPRALQCLFSGKSRGKLLVRLTE
jgi:NADPH-dependent curcumin reductase CurA